MLAVFVCLLTLSKEYTLNPFGSTALSLAAILHLVGAAVSFISACLKRSKDIGWSPWVLLVVFIPYVFILILVLLILLPSDYDITYLGESFSDYIRGKWAATIKLSILLAVAVAQLSTKVGARLSPIIFVQKDYSLEVERFRFFARVCSIAALIKQALFRVRGVALIGAFFKILMNLMISL